MTNHPNRSYRYYRICPRGFANEVTYLRIPAGKVAEVEAYFDGEVDRQFDRGNTDYNDGWTTDRRAHQPGVAIDWADYLADFT